MRARLLLMSAVAVTLAVPTQAQEIVKVPEALQPSVKRPDDLFQLPPGQWHLARHIWEGDQLCDETSCEAGFTSGDVVVSVERSGKFVRVIAGLRDCQSVGFSEIESGNDPGRYVRKQIAGLVDDVVKVLGKTCKKS